MKISFQNFGPISSGTVDIRPLTVLIGDNSAGKSFAAMAAHAMLRGLSDHHITRFQRRYRARSVMQYAQRTSLPSSPDKIWRELHQRLLAEPVNTFIQCTEKEILSLESAGYLPDYTQSLVSSFEDVFATPVPNLMRHGTNKGSVALEYSDGQFSVQLHNSKSKNTYGFRSEGGLRIGYVDRRRTRSLDIPPGSNFVMFKPGDQSRHKENFEDFVDDLLSACEDLQFQFTLPSTFSYYIPAIRSGLLLSHRLFLSLLVRNVQRAGFEPLNIPQMTGVTADFLESLLIDPSSRRRPRYSHTDTDLKRFESAILQGEVYFKQEDKEGTPTVHFKDDSGLDIPLNLASSTITEVAPLFLVLRQIPFPLKQCVFIIEEPESHLSPTNQVHMASFLATLVNRGAKVVVTTHSTFLLEKVNNLIALGISSSRTDALNPEDVSAYYVARTADGSKVTELQSGSSGIDMSSFIEKYQELFDESMASEDED